MRAWFRQYAEAGWATTALTQRRSYASFATGRPAFRRRGCRSAVAHLAHPRHRLLALDFGFDAVLSTCTGGLLGHRQVTDAWLL
jgi:hypothetical protein